MGTTKIPLNDREYAPGQHGQRRKKTYRLWCSING